MRNGQKTGFAKRRDKNEPEIIRALEAIGCTVERLNAKGVPDLLVGIRLDDAFGPGMHLQTDRLLEVKGSKGALTSDQVKWWSAWRGRAPLLVRTPEEAIEAMGLKVPQPGVWTFCPRMIQGDSCDGRPGNRCPFDGRHLIGTYPRGK